MSVNLEGFFLTRTVYAYFEIDISASNSMASVEAYLLAEQCALSFKKKKPNKKKSKNKR